MSAKGEYTSKKRGVAPIVDKFDEDSEFFKGACVADKVIGKAAAMLLVKYGVKEIYAEVISDHAVNFLADKNVSLTYNVRVEYIINRTKTDMCPMEKTVLNISDETEGEQMIRRKLLCL